MREYSASKNALLYWAVRLTAIAIVPFLISAWTFGKSQVEWTIFTLCWMAVYLFLAFFWYPVKYKRLRLALKDGMLCIRTGVLYTRWKYIDFSSVQYFVLCALPVQRLFRMRSVMIYGSGCFLYAPCLSERDALELRDTVTPLARRMKLDG